MVQGKLGHSPREVYDGIRSSAVASLLLHKSKAAIASDGPLSAGLLLQDWMVILAAHYIQNCCKEENGGGYCDLEVVWHVSNDSGYVSLSFDYSDIE